MHRIRHVARSTARTTRGAWLVVGAAARRGERCSVPILNCLFPSGRSSWPGTPGTPEHFPALGSLHRLTRSRRSLNRSRSVDAEHLRGPFRVRLRLGFLVDMRLVLSRELRNRHQSLAEPHGLMTAERKTLRGRPWLWACRCYSRRRQQRITHGHLHGNLGDDQPHALAHTPALCALPLSHSRQNHAALAERPVRWWAHCSTDLL